jgi:hypothetical protein
MIVELAARNKFLLDSIDNWLRGQPSLVIEQTKSLIPVVRERQALSDGLAKYLALLGLKRSPRELDVNSIDQ